MFTSERKIYKGNESIHIYGDHGAKLMVERDEYGRLTYAFASAPGAGTWTIGCVHHQTLRQLMRRFKWLHVGKHLPEIAKAKARAA